MMSSDGEDLPSLEDIFSKPMKFKRLKTDQEEFKLEEEKENVEKFKEDLKTTSAETEDDSKKRSDLKRNEPVFAMDHYNKIFVPALIIEGKDDKDLKDLYTLRFYDGRVERLGRRFIFCQDDPEFYSITTIPLKTVTADPNSLIRKLNEKSLLKIVKKHKKELKKILCGALKSSRDEIFRSAYGQRASLNSGNIPGPFTIDEYNFLMEHIPKVFVPKLLQKDKELREVLELRFGQSGGALDHTLRQYSYLVLVPELAARHVLKLEKSYLKSVDEAFDKLFKDSKSYDLETGNFINYLYSSRDMYRLARRERT